MCVNPAALTVANDESFGSGTALFPPPPLLHPKVNAVIVGRNIILEDGSRLTLMYLLSERQEHFSAQTPKEVREKSQSARWHRAIFKKNLFRKDEIQESNSERSLPSPYRAFHRILTLIASQRRQELVPPNAALRVNFARTTRSCE